MFFLRSSWEPDSPSIVIFVDMFIFSWWTSAFLLTTICPCLSAASWSPRTRSYTSTFVSIKAAQMFVTATVSYTCIAALCHSRDSTDELIVTGKSSCFSLILSANLSADLSAPQTGEQQQGEQYVKKTHQTWSSWRRHSLWRNSFLPSLLA